MAKLYPDAHCALDFRTPLELLVATILSAQCTDVRVNMVTPALFARYRSAQDYADADVSELESMIQSTGFFRSKAKSLRACGRLMVDQHGGEVPRTLDELIQFPGIGRKTANVILGNCFDVPGITVDTHVGRVSRRLALTVNLDPVKVEHDLMEIIPKKDWVMFSHRMIYHGRQVCFARKPACERCALADICPKVGVTSI